MNLFSIWRSSSIEILYSKRIVGILYAIVGLLILATMASAYIQFFNAYLYLHEFDVSVGDFILSSVIFFFPLWTVGAVILRACLQRIRLELWIRNAIKLVSYNTKLSPAEAGFLVDFTYSSREFTATLLDLNSRGVIRMSIDSVGSISIVQVNTTEQTSKHEQALLYALSGLGDVRFQGFSDIRLIKAAKYAHDVLIDELTERRVIQKEYIPNRVVRRSFRIISILAGFAAAVLLGGLLIHPSEIFTLIYPRYPVEFSQVVTLVVIGIIIASVLISSMWPRLGKDYKSTGYAAWIDAAGLLMYVRAVFKHRFSERNIAQQDVSSLRNYSAYAVAYGVVPDSPKMISKILDATS